MKGAAILALVTVAASALAASSCEVPHSARNGSSRSATVVHVADGDTLTVRMDATGITSKVRLLAIDAPESYTTRYGYTECGGEQAKEMLKRLAAAHPQVRVVADPTQDPTDRYGRTLAYIDPQDGSVSFQHRMVAAGWASVYRYRPSDPPSRAESLEVTARRAHAERRGVWQSCGGFHVREAAR